jgi:hypothetical protein
MRKARVFVLFLCTAVGGASRANAQASPRDFPDRAIALRPTGMAESSATWGMYRDGIPEREYFEEHLLVASFDARVPIDSLVLEVSVVDAFYWIRLDEDGGSEEGAYNRFGNPRFGASWHEHEAGWRLELGGAVNVPYLFGQTLDPWIASTAVGTLTFEPGRRQLERYRGGWNAFQLAADRFALVAHGRFEVDVDPQVVLATELDLPVVIELDSSDATFSPQLALEASFRFLGFSHAGLRAQAVVVRDAWGYGLTTLVEAFLRLVIMHQHVATTFRLGVSSNLGPAQVASFTSRSFTDAGLFGVTLGAGALF